MGEPLREEEEERQAQALFHTLRARQGGRQLTLWEQPQAERVDPSPVDLADLFGREFQVVLADPPWLYRNTGVNGAAARHYPTLPTPEICRLPERLGLQCSPNSVLFLWATNPLLEDALTVIRAWGFVYKAKIVWVKDTLGTGFYVRSMTEDLLIATRGSFTPTAKRIRPAISSLIVAPTREHSRKPDEAYTLIERLYPDTVKIELFARHRRPGWAAWGDQL